MKNRNLANKRVNVQCDSRGMRERDWVKERRREKEREEMDR